MKKILKKLIVLFLFLTIFVFAAFVGLLFSDKSSELVATCVKKYGAEYVNISELRGNVARSLQFDDILIKTPALDIGLERLEINWTLLSVLMGQLPIESIKVQELTFYFKDSPAKKETYPSGEPFVFPLPEKLIPYLAISLGQLDVKGIAFVVDGDRQVEYLDMARISVDVDGYDLEIKELTVDDKAYGASLSGHAVTGANWWADIKGDWRFSNWDGGELLGNLTASGPLDDMDVTVQLLAPTFVDIKGKMTKLPGNPYFEVTGRGDKASLLVVHPNCPDIRLDAYVEASGYVNAYHGELKSKGEYWKYKGAEAIGVLNGDFDGLKFESFTAKHGDTQVDIPGVYLDWEDEFIVGSRLTIKNFHPQVFAEEFSGSLNGTIDGKLTVSGEENDVLGVYKLTELKGNLRKYPVVGDLDMEFTDTSLTFNEVNFESGSSKIHYQGDFREQIKMSLNFKSNDFGEILPESTGSLSVQVDASGSYEDPVLSGQLKGEALKIYDLSLTSASGIIKGAAKDKNGYQVNLKANDLKLHALQASKAVLTLSGDLLNHNGLFDLQSASDNAGVNFSGELKDGLWKAKIKDLFVSQNVIGDWRLLKESQLELDSTKLKLSKTCLQNNSTTSCWQTEVSFVNSGDYSLNANLSNYDMTQWSGQKYKLQGRADGNLDISGNAEGVKSGKGVFKLVDVGINEDKFFQQFKGGQAVLTSMFEGEKIVNDLKLSINKHNLAANIGLDWNGDLSADWLSLPLAGKIDVSHITLGFLGIMTDYSVESKGIVEGDLTISGSIESPYLEGGIFLKSGSISLAKQGIDLERINLNVSGAYDNLIFAGSIFSGGGKAHISGLVGWDLEQGPTGRLRISGKDFQILDLPESQVFASPQVDLTFDKDSAKVSGSVVIPRAEILAKSGEDAVVVSDDVVVVNVSKKYEESQFQLNTDLEIRLGNAVNFNRYDIVGRLVGNFRLQDTASKPMQADGALRLEGGTVNVYGRKMDISRGGIIFSGGSILNPSLDVRIEKEVRVQSEAESLYKVGVDISGFANNPQYNLYSSPYMDDAEIFSYLLLGYSTAEASNEDSTILAKAAGSIGWHKGASVLDKLSSIIPIEQLHLESDIYDDDVSLVVGRNLTSKLYIGYDYNIFDQVGEGVVRYNLYKGFYVLSKYSSEATGADLIYVWER
ncbi:MAG: translocation/assembly module TamB domain-containing protein [Desulfotalea sp.]